MFPEYKIAKMFSSLRTNQNEILNRLIVLLIKSYVADQMKSVWFILVNG